MKPPKYSIACVISRPDIFDKCLLQSINSNRTNHDIEIIPIYNNNNLYSASVALNIGLQAAKSDIVVIAHQDVILLNNWFSKLDEIIATLPENWGLISSAGIAKKYSTSDIGEWGGAASVHTVAVGAVWDSLETTHKPPYWDGIKDTTTIHCADECMMVINKKIGLRFDSLFTGFHFYGVDICLQARAAGYQIYSGYLPIIHYGKYSASFTGNHKYWVYLRLLYNKWRVLFPEVLGTHFHWNSTTEELVSYIDITVSDGSKNKIDLLAMGLGKVRMNTDRKRGLIHDQ